MPVKSSAEDQAKSLATSTKCFVKLENMDVDSAKGQMEGRRKKKASLETAGSPSSSKSPKAASSKKAKEEEEKKEEEVKEEVKEEEEEEKENKPKNEDAATASDDDEDDFKPDAKKRRRSSSTKKSSSTPAAKRAKADKPKVERCSSCRQDLAHPSLSFYAGHPDGAVEEMIALTDPSLAIDTTGASSEDASADDSSLMDSSDLPSFRVTNFTFYDPESHVVPFDNGIIERNGEIYFSGYLKPVTDDSALLEGGVPVCQAGPVTEWWVAGYDGGQRHMIGVSTEMGLYYLTQPSAEFRTHMEQVDQKVFIAKVVVDFLNEAKDTRERIEYEDLLTVLETKTVPGYPGMLGLDGKEVGETKPINEDAVIRHADFVVSQVSSYEQAGDDDEEAFMMETPAIQDLIAMAGLNRAKKFSAKKDPTSVPRVRRAPKTQDKAKKALFTKATTTCLVRSVFEQVFKDQLAEGADGQKVGGARMKRCNVCDNCLKPECGECAACKNMKRFGGTGTSKQACEQRKCSNMSMIGDDPSASNSDDESTSNAGKKSKKHRRSSGGDAKNAGDTRIRKPKKSSIKWVGDALREKAGKTFYEAVSVNGEEYKTGDFGLFFNDLEEQTFNLRRIQSLFEEDDGTMRAHVQWFEMGTKTVLGDTADEREVFQLLFCDDDKLEQLIGRAEVKFWPITKNWAQLGGTEALPQPPVDFEREHSYWYRMRYEAAHARFEHGYEMAKSGEAAADEAECQICPHKKRQQRSTMTEASDLVSSDCDDKGKFHFRSFLHNGVEYRLEDGVFLLPSSAGKSSLNAEDRVAKKQVDEDKYPEYYRKNAYVKGSNEKTPRPFQVGIVEDITCPDKEGKRNLRIAYRRLYRPEDTHLAGTNAAFAKDVNFVYWSDHVVTTDVTLVHGKCYPRAECALDKSPADWTNEGEFRFYYNMSYNKQKRELEELDVKAEKFGMAVGGGAKGGKGGKGKGDAAKNSTSSSSSEKRSTGTLPPLSSTRPLRTLDVFAGCGGLSLGLHQSGVATSDWAVEVYDPAARAFKLNNPDCTVFSDDCNLLLKMAMEGEEHNDKRQAIPKKGEVELLCGGPPCQGFSGMNRFNSREYSAFKNSLISTYLSYCDFYRPKYFILENVRNFASFKKSVVLKMCLRALLRMGYACTFGILQAGNFGVAQTRRRAILLAAAPGESLPLYPEPMHVFTKCSLSVQIDEKVYTSNCKWMASESAPFRTVTVRDCMSDLPPITNGQQDEVMSYEDEPMSHFQRHMREKSASGELRDHVCKVMSALVEARMSLIPTEPGSDWRDLPNIVMKLKDGTYTDKLVYNYNDQKQGKGKKGALRGVCICATAQHKECNPEDKQGNTLIPWCLPHTSNRHNHWAGLYGRLEEDGFFSTTVTNPEPMGKQGRVLHPQQHRLVSVRECARSQGFPDWYQFYGNLLEKHRQVGNAVPPPMGRALGLEIRKARAKAADN